MNSEILICADKAESFEERKQIVEAALEAGFTQFIFKDGDDTLKKLGRCSAFTNRGGKIFADENPKQEVGIVCRICGTEDMEKAYEVNLPLLIIEPTDWKVIPLENLISRFQNTKTKIFASVKSVDEARLALLTMEVGVDGICIDAQPEDFSAFTELAAAALPEIELHDAKITAITPLTLGDRVCIDTCTLMGEGDGMFIGSQSSALFYVCSESFQSEYVNSRPFRVNAGAVHSYILKADGTTQYLSELKSGSSVLVRKADGKMLEVSVGRIKTEIRPLLLIEAEAGGKTCSVILQNAETIKLAGPNGPRSVTELSPGDCVFVRLEKGGRHFGHLMQETILEK